MRRKLPKLSAARFEGSCIIFFSCVEMRLCTWLIDFARLTRYSRFSRWMCLICSSEKISSLRQGSVQVLEQQDDEPPRSEDRGGFYVVDRFVVDPDHEGADELLVEACGEQLGSLEVGEAAGDLSEPQQRLFVLLVEHGLREDGKYHFEQHHQVLLFPQVVLELLPEDPLLLQDADVEGLDFLRVEPR